MTNDQFRSQFRLPYPLYERLKAEAEAHQRSLNAEIIARLEASFDADPVERLVKILDDREGRLLEEVRAAVRGVLTKGEGAP